MFKVTSKLQLTLPRALAEAHGIRAGSEVAFESGVGCIRLVVRLLPAPLDAAEKRRLLAAAWERQLTRNARYRGAAQPRARGWERESLYGRG